MSKAMLDQASPAPTPDGPAGSGSNQRRSPYPHLFRLLHWVLPLCMILAFLTGLSLHAISRPEWSLFSGVLPSWFWGGRVHLFHLATALVFCPSLLAVLWLYCRKKARRRATHLTLVVGGLLMIFAGLLLLNPVGPAWVNSLARVLHAVSGLIVLPVALVWHTVDGLGRFRGALIGAFHPWASPAWKQLGGFVPLVLITTCLVTSILPGGLMRRNLVAKRVSRIAAELTAEAFDGVSPLVIELANGAAYDKGRTQVTLRALHDGNEIFVLAEWLDPTENRRYMPWQKTADGWRRLVSDENDESIFYEDKFALMFPTRFCPQFSTFGCAVYCHAGGGRAYGYKGAEETVDVWHWKATRVDPVGQIDDKYWSRVDFEAKDVGRHGDPKQSGGYSKNVGDDPTHPAFLPADPSAVHRGIIFKDRAVPYSPEAAERIRPDTIIPGIVAAPAVGDRGDVACQSHHDHGRWQLLIRRKLDTGSQYDVKLIPGRSHPFGCAAFDNSSKRHAYGFTVHGLVLEE